MLDYSLAKDNCAIHKTYEDELRYLVEVVAFLARYAPIDNPIGET